VILLSLLRTASDVQADIDARLAAVGLSLAKLAALQVLADAREPIALTTLAERLSCVKSNITQLVDRLDRSSAASSNRG
jgi:DNA-binding MarR family transcriptional regulator